ncbi:MULTISPECIES: hypothetical protein [Mesorhizobium]|uniref:Uncharacterized protein n=4 Tax=Mesorhizobium TaxID=68287 RepID=A0A1A5ILY0_RHILI|nr:MULTISPECIES: hypothetical protein [Mesorhizobium]MBE1711579.1 hypothetical protein [Mesorhizobium japonicum]MBE1716397.1 hypothetical protein [Mesorhizobium japonicum]MUT24039.1 hypothetical protein [Mesorhizobium japonicum]MUT30830.1 hypothetical protein [Mesorhizobium japonicum]OBP71840.1 hypothetical protein BAE41_15790 [Mesorhizobium loti]
MTQLTSLIREVMPAWLRRHAAPQSGEAAAQRLRPEDADAVWRKAVENDLFGANTPDYAETGEKEPNRH